MTLSLIHILFLWYGKSDHILKLFGFDQQGPALQSALEKMCIRDRESMFQRARVADGDAPDNEW